jgi:hypothetical protein
MTCTALAQRMIDLGDIKNEHDPYHKSEQNFMLLE